MKAQRLSAQLASIAKATDPQHQQQEPSSPSVMAVTTPSSHTTNINDGTPPELTSLDLSVGGIEMMSTVSNVNTSSTTPMVLSDITSDQPIGRNVSRTTVAMHVATHGSIDTSNDQFN
jgi:hypothetical protein